MECILQGTDYEEIEDAANNLIEDLGLEQSQLNCFEVVFLLGIGIKKYSELPAADRIFLMSKSRDGFSIRTERQYVIYYNDSLDKDRIRFSIWNEIAHIQLGHLEADCHGARAHFEEDAKHFANYIITYNKFSYTTKLYHSLKNAYTKEIRSDHYYKQLTHYCNTIMKNHIMYENLLRLWAVVS
ncbi:MAG: ImmA/IrrE family metallo-endopeptidase [Treponema sp.]|nr:ImmA/IrrE family metallo-endopeptidase [Treponema sp.]